jgi:flagellar protein FliO/FliZ
MPAGYGWALLKVTLALALVCLLAYVALRLLRRLSGLGGGAGSGALRIIERCPLSPRQTLWLVEVAGRYFLLGATDQQVTRLAELEPGTIPPPPERPSLRELLSRKKDPDPDRGA